MESKRLRFRHWNETDFKQFANFYSDPSQARFVGGQKLGDAAWRHMALLMGHWALKGFGYWAIEEKSTGDLVGCVGFWHSPGWPECEMGYWIHPQKQRQGFAFEACQRCLLFAKEELQPESLVSYIDPENLASQKLALKLGAVLDKTIDLDTHGPHHVFRYDLSK